MKVGRKPFGSTESEKATIDIVRLASRRVRGGRVPTLQSIADKLNAAGHRTKMDNEFSTSAVYAILRKIRGGRLRKQAKRVKKTQLASGDFRSEGQITDDKFYLQGQLRVCGMPQLDSLWRLNAIYNVLLGTGLRASELCDLRCGDVDVAKRMVNVRRGKGAKQRTVIVSADTASVLHDLCGIRPNRHPVFTNSSGNKLTYKALWRRGRKIAGIIGDSSFHLHCLRHTFATRLYNYKKDIKFVKEQLGHSSIATTDIYAKTLNADKLRQMDAMDALGKSADESGKPEDTTSKRTDSP